MTELVCSIGVEMERTTTRAPPAATAVVANLHPDAVLFENLTDR
jgi:hypothetical protein